MLLYLIWLFLIGSIALMIGVMIYNEWVAPQPVESLAADGDAAPAPMVLSSDAPAPISYGAEPSRAPSRGARKPAAKAKPKGRTAARRR